MKIRFKETREKMNIVQLHSELNKNKYKLNNEDINEFYFKQIEDDDEPCPLIIKTNIKDYWIEPIDPIVKVDNKIVVSLGAYDLVLERV